MVLITFVPNGDLLGYLRKSRGEDDKYFNDPDIKPSTDITSKHLISFARDIACGMHFLASNKVNINSGTNQHESQCELTRESFCMRGFRPIIDPIPMHA